jgi:hypothetical protein
LPIADCQVQIAHGWLLTAEQICNWQFAIGNYFCSLCAVCFLQNRQYLLSSIRSVVFFLFLLVL